MMRFEIYEGDAGYRVEVGGDVTIISPDEIKVRVPEQGPQGPSAYQAWLRQPGNAGKTEAEFIESLRGADGGSLEDPGDLTLYLLNGAS